MGLFDGLAGMLGGAGGQGGAGEIIGEMLNKGRPGASSGVLGSILGGMGGFAGGPAGATDGAPAAGGGGMAGMLEQLAAGGLAEHVSSWLSNNPNLPISPQQIHDALGSEQVQSMARSSGLPVGDLLSQLAAHLPQAASEQAGTPAS